MASMILTFDLNMIPKNIWVEIWSGVDFRTRQKSCTLVCKYWFEGIRGSTSLSGEMALDNSKKSLEDINLVLSHWEKLRIVRLSCGLSNDELLQLDTHPSLERIIFPRWWNPCDIGIWGKVSKVCFDLKNKSSEITSIENVVELHLLNFFDNWHWWYPMYEEDKPHPFLECSRDKDISLEPMARMMLNLESLHVLTEVNQSENPEKKPEEIKYFAPFFRGLQHCKNLSELILPNVYFGDFAKYTPNIKRLEIRGCYVPLEDQDWIANLEKLEFLKLEGVEFNDEEIDIEDFTGKMFSKLTNLKSLELTDGCSLMYETDFLLNINELIPSLKTILMRNDGKGIRGIMHCDCLVEMLDSIRSKNRHRCVHRYPPVFYLVNNKDFPRTLPNSLNEDQTKAIFQTAMDFINKKFPIDSISIEIVDCEYGWNIKKERKEPPTMSQLAHKCTVKDEQGRTCTEFFAEKAELEKHVEEALKHGSGHMFPFCF